jgi:hypothetical protein
MYRSTIILTSALVGGEWSASRHGRFTPGERASCTHWIGGWVDLRAGLGDLEKREFLTIPGLKPFKKSLPLRNPAVQQTNSVFSLYSVFRPSFYVRAADTVNVFINICYFIRSLAQTETLC